MANVNHKVGEVYEMIDPQQRKVVYKITGIYFEDVCGGTCHCDSIYGVSIFILENSDTSFRPGEEKKYARCCGIISEGKLISKPPAEFSPQHGDWVEWQGAKYRVAFNKEECFSSDTCYGENIITIECGDYLGGYSGRHSKATNFKEYGYDENTGFYNIRISDCKPCDPPTESKPATVSDSQPDWVSKLKIGDKLKVKKSGHGFVAGEIVKAEYINIYNSDVRWIDVDDMRGQSQTVFKETSPGSAWGFNDWLEPCNDEGRPKTAELKSIGLMIHGGLDAAAIDKACETIRSWKYRSIYPVLDCMAPVEVHVDKAAIWTLGDLPPAHVDCRPVLSKPATTLIGKYFDRPR